MSGSTRTRTPKARALGAAIRECREGSTYSQRKLAAALGRDPGLMSRWESGDRVPLPTDVAQILTKLDVNGERYDNIMAMTEGTDDSAWLAVTLPDQKRQLEALLECERTASHIAHVAPLLVPGVLQTADYARAIMSTAVQGNEVETRVMVRLGRRDVITRATPAHLRVYLGEAACRQVVGNREITAAQLRYLREMAELPNVDVRVVPFDSNWYAGLEGMFIMIDSDEAPTVVHLENRKSGIFLHEDEDVAAYRAGADSVAQVAMNPADSDALIAKIADEMEEP